MRYFFSIVILLVFVCFKSADFDQNKISKVEVQTLLEDESLNIRALKVEPHGEVVFATSDGRLGFIYKDSYDNEKVKAELPIAIKYDSITPNFRAIASNGKSGFVLSIASPALLFKVDKGNYEVVYKEDDSKAFYDAMTFWNENEGIAMGDPTDGCISVIITRDGGNSWSKIPCGNLPKATKGEAAFAASDTNIAVIGDKTWIATGGMASRILFSPDKGKTWEVYNTPIVQGKETTGMYSIDFYDENNGFAIGGDYTKSADSTANKIRTRDGGKTWQLVAKNQSPGYRSCVQYVPNGNGKELVAVGFKGIDYSNDAGNSWIHLSDEGFYTLRFENDSTAYAAGNKRISKLTFK